MQRDGGTIVYQVEHPPWRVWEVGQSHVDVDIENLYGSAFSYFLKKDPASAFLAEGSEVKVFKGMQLKR